jgi:hypothetical protein
LILRRIWRPNGRQIFLRPRLGVDRAATSQPSAEQIIMNTKGGSGLGRERIRDPQFKRGYILLAPNSGQMVVHVELRPADSVGRGVADQRCRTNWNSR